MGDMSLREERLEGGASILALREGLEALRRAGGMVAPNNDVERCVAATAGMGASVTPVAWALWEGDRLVGAILGRRSRRRVRCSVGYASVPSPKLRCLDVVYGGILSGGDGAVAARLGEILLRELDSGGLDHVMVNHLPTSDPSAAALGRGRLVRCAPAAHWRYELPEGGYEGLSAQWSSKHRNTLRRKDKALSAHFGDDLSLRVFTRAEEAEEFASGTAALASRTYQAALGAAFEDSAVWRNILGVEAGAGRFRCYWLVGGGRPIAFQVGFVYDNVYMMESLGHEPELSRLSPGMVLLHRVFRDLCEAGVRAYDYGFGDADYKRTYGSGSREEATLRLYGARARARLTWAMDAGAMRLAARLEAAAARGGGRGRIKRWWRERLAARRSGGGTGGAEGTGAEESR